MTRIEKREKLQAIYAKALGVMLENLGVDKDQVYAACSALTTVSRELGTVEHTMRMLNELEVEAVVEGSVDSIGWAELLKAGEAQADA